MGAFVIALFATACGGLSVRHDETDAGVSAAPATTTTTPDAGGGGSKSTASATVDDGAACGRVCETCLAGTLSQDCTSFCTGIFADAATAGCKSALSSLIQCQDRTNEGCSTELCGAQNNALTACILDFCDAHEADVVCDAPL
jgi:hypothetical protein